jgi:phage major head subunit gpT-like protein
VTESVPGSNARKKGIPVNKDEDDDDVSKYKEEEERETFLLLDCDKAIRPTVAMNDTVMHDQSDTEDKVFFRASFCWGVKPQKSESRISIKVAMTPKTQ